MDNSFTQTAANLSKALSDITDVFNKFAGELAGEVGGYLADKVREHRARNLLAVLEMALMKLREIGLAPSPVPPRLFIPIVDAASLESDRVLQEYWAGLLASASEKSDSLSPAFLEILRQLTPSEAKALKRIYEDLVVPNLKDDTGPVVLPFLTMPAIAFDNLERVGIFREGTFGEDLPYTLARSNEELPHGHVSIGNLVFTRFGIEFMKACLGPKDYDSVSVKNAAGNCEL